MLESRQRDNTLCSEIVSAMFLCRLVLELGSLFFFTVISIKLQKKKKTLSLSAKGEGRNASHHDQCISLTVDQNYPILPDSCHKEKENQSLSSKQVNIRYFFANLYVFARLLKAYKVMVRCFSAFGFNKHQKQG